MHPIKVPVTVHGVSVVNRNSFKFGRFVELIRAGKVDGVFKKWEGTVREQKNKPFANGFVTYQHP